MAWSSTLPDSGHRSLCNSSTRGVGSVAANTGDNACSVGFASGPDTRITAMAAFPVDVADANTVEGLGGRVMRAARDCHRRCHNAEGTAALRVVH